MPDLKGVNLRAHLESILAEFKARETIYGFPRRKMYCGFPGLDLGVNFHGRRAETLLGPAAGPHTQMAQNIVQSFLGGARFMELKTIQILDQLEIPRPCIDIRNVGYNVEWSQEMRLEESFTEYVTAWVLLKLIEELEILGVPRGAPFYDMIFEVSLGYDLAGIQSPQVHSWLQNIKNAETTIKLMLESLPAKFDLLKKIDIDAEISNSVTLSTFHGCPASEIESIVEFLIAEHRFHVMVKMNPTILGYDFVNRTLRQELGYKNIQLDQASFDRDLSFKNAVAMMKRLKRFAAKHGLNVGAKFTNTLVVKNNQNIFSDKTMYLSGAPLHVLAMNALQKFRNAMGAEFPISFSAGISKDNFIDAVLCNLRPVTTCTDLLKEGGYTRFFYYLKRLRDRMEMVQNSSIEEFIISQSGETGLAAAGVEHTNRIVPQLIQNPLYRQSFNSKVPPKIASHLMLFDCLNCNKCLPVCPNAANFSFVTEPLDLTITNYGVKNNKLFPITGEKLIVKKKRQIATLADFCNECGNCDTYCPELGGPFIEKPRFFLSVESYKKFQKFDGFHFLSANILQGRIEGKEYSLHFDSRQNEYRWRSEEVELHLDADCRLLSGNLRHDLPETAIVEMQPFHIMQLLIKGIMTDRNVYPVNFFSGV